MINTWFPNYNRSGEQILRGNRLLIASVYTAIRNDNQQYGKGKKLFEFQAVKELTYM